MGVATAIAAGTAIAGIGMSVAQAVKQDKLAKKAKQDAISAKQRAQAITEQNPFMGVQVPTMANKMAMQEINQASANTVDALQSAGAEGVVGGVSQVNKATNDALLNVAADQNQMQYQRDMATAENQSGINERKAERDYFMEMNSFQQANQNMSDAQYNKNQAIMNAFGSAQSGIGAIQNSDLGVYKKQFGDIDVTAKDFNPDVLNDQQRKTYDYLKSNPQLFNQFSNM